ncbi:membrane protein [Leifsonia kafniensis]|uniref:Membrane protein n=1 Tax=Leifsonia kafniensis TaxID=475957 RepID=A0ABP7KT12_9MICO
MTRRIPQLLIGLFLYGIGIALMVRGQIGVAPWDVLTQGIDKHTHLGFGLITMLMSGVVLLLWIPIRQRLGIGTVLNALLVGPSADVGLWLIPADQALWLRIVFFALGLLTVGVATGLYIGAHFGPGPRDGLMTGLHRRTGLKIWIVRTGIEVVVLGIGWLLGGNVGVGTVLFALLIGPICNYTIPFFAIKRPVTVTVAADAQAPAPATKPVETA